MSFERGACQQDYDRGIYRRRIEFNDVRPMFLRLWKVTCLLKYANWQILGSSV